MVKAKYTWLADGTKAGVREPGTNGNGFEYLGSLVYQWVNGELKLESAPTGSGRIVVSEGSSGKIYTPYYHVTDHLGSVRVVADPQGVSERNDYYAFGSRWDAAGSAVSDNRYRYNGKELQTTGELGYLDYGARMYDARLGRWHSLDPMSEKYLPVSPFAYCLNNPLKFIDPDGRKIVDANGRVMYANGKWLSNATDGAKLIGNNMMHTRTGRQSFTKLANAKYGVQLIYDSETSNSKNIGLSVRKYNTTTGETTKATITVFEKNLVGELDDLNAIQSQGQKASNPTESQAAMLRVGVPTQAERIGQVGVHEAEHVINPEAYKNEGPAVKAEIKAIGETALLRPLPVLKVEFIIPEIKITVNTSL